MCTTPQALQILQEAYRTCSKALSFPIVDAYLYGSYARGDSTSESDVDILLTADIADEDVAGYLSAIGEVASDLSLSNDVTVSITLEPVQRFKRFLPVLPFYQNVVKEGIRYAG